MEQNKVSQNRVIFLDNLRYLFVLFVIVLHSGNAYCGLFFLKWWPVSEAETSKIVGLIQGFLDVFIMPLLFYIAGYFALPSLKKHGVASFIKGKFKRLGIPWLVCTLTICPILPLVYHYTRDGMVLSKSYLDLWIILLKSFAQFNLGTMSMNDIMAHDGFYQRYMWFISLLLFFFIVFAILYKIKRKSFVEKEDITAEAASVTSTLKLLFIIGLLSFVSSMILIGLTFKITGKMNPTAWFTLGNIIQFQLMRIAPFIIYFTMGVMTYKNKWIERGTFPGHFNTCMVSFAILLAAYSYLFYGFVNSPLNSKAMRLYGFLSFPVQNFLTIATLGFFASLAVRYWNRPRKIDRNLAAASYDMYLSHYIFVLVFQLALLMAPGIPPLVKFMIVAVSSIACSYAVSRFLVKPYPRLTAALLFGMTVVMFAVIRL